MCLALALLVLAFLLVFSEARPDMDAHAQAQVGADVWTSPVNVSHSGAASSPVILAQPDGALRIFWWDRFDGLTVAETTGVTATVWGEPQPVPILVPQAPRAGVSATIEFIPIRSMPRLVSDSSGTVHAFWLGEADTETHVQPLLHSSLLSIKAGWSSPKVIAASAVALDVAAGPTGALHLAYITAIERSGLPAGLFTRHSDDGGASWDAPLPVQQSRYFRLLTAETALVHLVLDDGGTLYLAWDDPRLGLASFARLAPGVATWELLEPVGDSDSRPAHARVIAVPGGEDLLLWEDARFEDECNLYQTRVGNAASERVLSELTVCPRDEQFLAAGDGQVLLAAADGRVLILAAWNGQQWSQPTRLDFSFEAPDSGQPLSLADFQTAMILPSGSGSAGASLVVVGIDQLGDVWAMVSRVAALDLAFAPPSAWSSLVKVAEGEQAPGMPALAADSEGRLHLLWSDTDQPGEPGMALYYVRGDTTSAAADPASSVGSADATRWTRWAKVIELPQGSIQNPAIVAVGDRLHAVWSDGRAGVVYYSQAFTRDAFAADEWRTPVVLLTPAGVGSRSDISVGSNGSLHVVCTVPVNEGRGIYYTRSDDGGETWTEVRQVFDAAAAGWSMADSPHLAVDAVGTVHVTWLRAGLPGSGFTEGIYYAHSNDGGQTWSSALEVVEGSYDWPQVVADGDQVHLLWAELPEGAWSHCWSDDGGLSWTTPARVPGFGTVPGQVTVQNDGAGRLYLVGLGSTGDGRSELLYSTWNGQLWGEFDRLSVDVKDAAEGVTAVTSPAGEQGWLDVVLVGSDAYGEVDRVYVWHARRAITSTAAMPVALATIEAPTPSPSPEPVLTTVASPQPLPGAFGTLPAGDAGSDTAPLPLLLGGGLAALVVAAAFGARYLWFKRR